MLFFVDDSTQTIMGRTAMAIGAVAIPLDEYNRFCRSVYRIKQEELGAQQLTEKELKGNSNFAKAAFLRQECSGYSPHLRAVDRLLNLLYDHHAAVISVSTFDASTIRTRDDLLFPDAYCELVTRMFKYAKITSKRGEWDGLSAIMLDQVGHRSDQRAGAAFQNYFTRTGFRYSLSKYFLQVPHFTHSSLSPGIQAADLLAYLACHQLDTASRPELQPYWEKFMSMQFSYLGQDRLKRMSCAPLDATHTPPMFDISADRADTADLEVVEDEEAS